MDKSGRINRLMVSRNICLDKQSSHPSTHKTQPERTWRYIPLGFIVISLALHCLLLGAFDIDSRLAHWRDPLKTPIVATTHRQTEQKPPTGQNNIRTINANTVQLTKQKTSEGKISRTETNFTNEAQRNSSPNDAADTDEGYLPRAFLSQSATPDHDINFDEINAPETGGTLEMRLWINSYGDVTAVDLYATEAPSWFTEMVVDKFANSRFRPALKNGKPVASIMPIEVFF